MPERIGTVIIGGGQAGLSVSRELAQAGVGHVVLERGRIGQSWRGRWDSFCLVTPNWSVQLPGHPYDGRDPDGFMPRDELVRYLESYAKAVDAPVREGVEVSSVGPQPGGGFALATSAGSIVASTVVLCTGAYQRPHRPAGAATLPADLLQIDVEDYRNPGSCRRARSWWSEAASPAARSPRSFTGRPGGLPRLRASRVGAAPDRGSRRVLVAPGGRRPRRPVDALPDPPPGWRPTCRRPGTAAVTTSITGRSSAWA